MPTVELAAPCIERCTEPLSSLRASIAQTHRPSTSSPSTPPGETFPVFDRPLFTNSRSCIRFAYTREGAPSRPASARMLDKSLDGGGAMLRLDAAAQAGIILSVLRQLGALQLSTLVASSCPETVPCLCQRACCCGKKLFTPWHDAIATLAEGALWISLPDGAMPLRRTTYPARVAVLVKLYARRLKIAEIANDLQLDADTVTKYHKIITRWLHGAKAGRNGEPPTEGVETAAWREAESLLRSTGIVGG